MSAANDDELCWNESSGGCGCERKDCGGYTCHRRDRYACDCFRHGPAVRHATVPVVMTSYADAWPVYRARGWPAFPLKAGTKNPPPNGLTGWDGKDPSGADCMELAEQRRYAGTAQTALRMLSTTAGLDFDAYDGRTGGQTLAEAERRWGALPKGPWSSARDDGVSGIRFFTIPDGLILVANLEFRELELGHVEVIQRHHRFAVVAPSVHPKLGTEYRWRDGTDRLMDAPPSVDELPALPAGWCLQLADGAAHNGERASSEQVDTFLAGLPAGTVCSTVRAALREAEHDLNHPVVSRHDDTTRHVLALLRLGERGHPGVPPALDVLRTLFIEAVTADESRTEKSADAEFNRMAAGDRGIGLITSSPTPETQRGCLFCDRPADPERSRRSLEGVVNKVLTAEPDKRERLLRWAARKIYAQVTEGQLTAESAAGLVVGSAIEVGLGETLAQRLVAEQLLRIGAGR